MDPSQAAQMITWLDQELRRAKSETAELRDLVEKLAAELADQRKRSEEVQARLSRLQVDAGRASQIDQAIQQLKAEMAAVVQEMRDEVRRHEQQSLQTRQVEREAEGRAQLELAQRVEQFLSLGDRVAMHATELQRQNEALTGCRQRLDNIDREMIRRTDQARLEAEERKREAGRSEAMQQTVDGLRGQAESDAARFQYLEHWAQGSAQRAAEMKAFQAEIQRLQGELMEGQRRSEQRVERQVREWGTITEGITGDHEAWANQMRIFAEQHERTKKTLTTVQDLAKALRMAQEEARQALELGMEKQRRELREFQSENEKRWTRYLSQWEFRSGELQKADAALAARLDELEAARSALQQELQALRSALAAENAAARAASLELWRFLLERVQRELDGAKATAENLRTRLALEGKGAAGRT